MFRRRRAPVAAHARPGIDEEGPRDGDALLLPSAQAHAPLANQRRLPIGKGLDEVRRRWKITMDKIRTFTLPSSAAPDTYSATSCAMSCAASSTCSVLHVPPNGRPCAPNAKARCLDEPVCQ